MRQEAQELIEALGPLTGGMPMPPDAAVALANLRRALSAPPATRRTVIGDLPVDVNSIDKLDAVLSATLDTLKNAQAAEARARVAAHVTRLAVELADAYMNRRATKPAFLPDSMIATVNAKRLRKARKAYREYVGEGDGDPARDDPQ